MTGGRRPIEYDERDEHVPRSPPPVLSADEVRMAATLSKYQRAMTFRRRANRVLRALQISFAQWRVLEAAWRLTRSRDDAVSHLDVAEDLELDEASVSRVMHLLSRRGLLDHGPDNRFYCWRVIVTERGEQLCSVAREVVADVAEVCGFGGPNER